MNDADLAFAAARAAEQMARIHEWCSPSDENLATLIEAVRATERERYAHITAAVAGLVEGDVFLVSAADDEIAQDEANRLWNRLMDAFHALGVEGVSE